MSAPIYFLSLCLVFGTILLVFGMKYAAAAFAARARLANDAAYRTLAETAVAAQSESRAALTLIEAELARLTASLATVEKILKQVE
jgi:uncharacterized membrane protein